MIFHPATIMIFFIILSLVFYNHNKNFLKLIAFLSPIMSSLSLFLGTGRHYFKLCGLRLIWDFNDLKKLIGLAFLLVLLSVNIYALSQKKYKELILGLVCCTSSFIGLLGEDFISMFFSIEIMMIMSSIIIFISNNSEKKNSTSIDSSAKKYFLIHFLASNMILIGISYVITKTNSLEIVSINKLVKNSQYSYIVFFIMLTGMLINVAAFPFSGWMINYYKEVSGCGFLYLIGFSTKLSIIILIKVFYGVSLLKYIGLATILYSGKKAICEDNTFALLSQLSLIATSGIILIGASYANELTLTGIMCYLFMHIIYKLLLAIVFVILKDIKNITFCSELGLLKNLIVLSCIIVGSLLMIGFPFTFTFYSKIALSKLISDEFFRFVIFFAGLLPIISFPWKEFINYKKIIALKMNVYHKISLIFTAILCLVTAFLWPLTPIKKIDLLYKEYYFYNELLKQLIIYGISGFIITILKVKRKVNTAINIFEKGFDLLIFLYKQWRKIALTNLRHKSQKYFYLGKQLTKKASTLYDQQCSVFLTISFLIFILTYLLTTLDNNKILVSLLI